MNSGGQEGEEERGKNTQEQGRENKAKTGALFHAALLLGDCYGYMAPKAPRKEKRGGQKQEQ